MTVRNPSGRAASLRVDASGRLLVSGSGGGGGSTSDLSYTASTGVVANTNGTGFTIPLATTSVRGLLDSADKVKIDGGFPSNLSYTASTGAVANSNGAGFTIPLATATDRGLLDPAEKTKLSSLTSVIVTQAADRVYLNNGLGVTNINAASETFWGALGPADKITLNRWTVVYRGTWASRPAASAQSGNLIVITDIGSNSRLVFYSDGTNWRPLNGSALLVQATGSASTPLATLTNTGGGIFTLPAAMTFPAGLLFPGARVNIRALFTRTTTGVNTDARIGLSTSGTAVTAPVGGGTLSGSNTVFSVDSDMLIYSATEGMQTPLGAWNTVGTSTPTSRTIATANAMTLVAGSTGTGAGDTLNLLAYSVRLFA